MTTTPVFRCFGTGDPLYEAYHDDEWGKPVTDTPQEQDLFERLALEGFMSGLSWLTVLRKRPAFRETFANFDPRAVAEFTAEDVERLKQDARIIRNEAKIRAAITNAKALLALHEHDERLMEWFVDHTPPSRPGRADNFEDLPSQTPETVALSTKMKKAGFTFVGPVTIYATMQAIGLVDDHLSACWKVSNAS